MKNVVLFLVLVVTAASASGLQIAGSSPGLCRSIPDSRFQIPDGRIGDNLEDTTVIAYDDGTHQTWWCSDKDSFGAAVRFTPAGYPCYIVGARAEVGYDVSQEVYLRVFDDKGAGGLPGRVLYEEQRLDIPHGQNVGFADYDLTAQVAIDSGDFYLCFWQKHYFSLLFGSDTHFDSIPRQWWFLPPNGWVTPSGMDAADHLIRARVLYSTGFEENLEPQASGLELEPAIIRGVLFLPGTPSHRPQAASLLSISGSRVLDLKPGANDARALAPGVYFVRTEPQAASHKLQAVHKVVVAR